MIDSVFTSNRCLAIAGQLLYQNIYNKSKTYNFQSKKGIC